jgi:transposase
MPRRYELTEAQWQEIRDLLTGKAGDRGRTAADNRTFVNGVLWLLRSGAYWCHIPERYGKWKSTHKRFTPWARAGVWEEVFEVLTRDSDNEYLTIDTTIVRAHQQARRKKREPKRPGFGALQRRVEHEDSPRHGCLQPSHALNRHRRPGQ